MILKNTDYGNCFLASGSLNFFGDGWSYDERYKKYFSGFKEVIETTTFVAKTTTFYPRPGNMPFDEQTLQPKEFKPKCIKVYPLKGAVLNAVGLSGPGAENLFKREKWQAFKRPFFISFMASGERYIEEHGVITVKTIDKLKETNMFVDLLAEKLSCFDSPVGLQINVSCPNTKHDTKQLAKEAINYLEVCAKLKLPIDLKINVLMQTEIVREIEASGLCDMLTLSNTIPYGTSNLGIDWSKFSRKDSPLANMGGGGLSGPPIFQTVLRRIRELREAGISMFIKGSGGISKVDDVDRMKLAGANAIEIGTVLILRPWRALDIVNRAKNVFS